jgi:hypothetical protein
LQTLTLAEQHEAIVGFGDHEKFCSHLQIRNKEGIAVPYRHSFAGLKLNRAIRKQEQAGVPVRICCLKASQVWMSSSTATEIFRRVPFFPGRRALVLADTQQHADLVFGYYEQYLQSYADNPYGSEVGAMITLPHLIKDTEQHLRWSNGSSVLVGTANNVDVGRSAPYNWAHLSEAAFYRALGRLMTGLMQRVPNSADSGVIVESTANGEGGDFYDLCQLAISKKSGWAFVFFGYHEHPENVMDPTVLGYKDATAFERTLDRLELQERAHYNLTIQQLAWRRFVLNTGCSGKIERFRQEHPGNPAESFQGTGRTIFDLGALSRMPTILEPTRGELQVYSVGIEKKVQFIASSDGRGELSIYRLPVPGHHYILGADHAEGVDPTAKDGASDPDYGSATVLDADSGEEVAKLTERYEPRPWAQRLYWLARFYNFAYLVPEQKAVGKAVIGHLLELEGGYPLELIYSAERDPSDRRPALLQELGYDTNTVLRPVLVSALDTAIRERSIQLHDPATMQQLRTFVRKPNGREEGIKHDDDVFGLALAVVGLPRARRAFAYREARATEGAKQWKPTSYRQQTRDNDED